SNVRTGHTERQAAASDCVRVRGSSSIDGCLSARLVPGPQRASVAAGVASTARRRLLSAAGRGGLPGFVYPCSGLPERTPRKPVERRRDVTVGHSIPYDARTTSDAVGTVALQTRTTIMLMAGTAHATTRLRRRRMRTRPVQVLHDGWTARHRGGQRGSTARIGRSRFTAVSTTLFYFPLTLAPILPSPPTPAKYLFIIASHLRRRSHAVPIVRNCGCEGLQECTSHAPSS
ncbi:hypothetical protein LSAT2_003917, partial [Lamellibrachia satsuma]